MAARVDAALAGLDARLDWLLALSPVGGDALWQAFDASGRTEVAPLRYIDLETDLDEASTHLRALPVRDIESPLLANLLEEKQRELERMVDLVRLRGSDGFVAASIELFGGVDAGLRALADDILATVGTGDPLQADTGIDAVMSAVEAELAWYRDQAADFSVTVVADADLDSMMMVSHGTFYIDAPSVLYLIGSTMDWREDDFAAGFVFENPNAKGACGCGESFTI